MEPGLSRALRELDVTRAQRRAALAQLVSIPSVSSDSARARDVQRAAAWLTRTLRDAGIQQIRHVATRGGPIILAERHACPSHHQRLLIYGHYDVVGAGDPGSWRTPAFSPVVRGRFIHGRGTSDDKGPLLCHLAALRAWLHTVRRLPVDVVCVLDGEEEVGSPGLRAFLQRHGRDLGATVAIVSDTRTLGPDQPTLITSLRGTLVCTVRVAGPRADLHSGQYGGAVHNPAEALARLLASLHDRRGRVTIPGFYDRVGVPGPAERARLARHAPPDTRLLADAGVRRGFGEAGWSAFERTTLRPSLTISRISAGRPATDSVIPSTAEAALSLRLVDSQSPAVIAEQLRRTLAERTPPSVRIEVSTAKAVPPWRIPASSPALRAASRALAATFPSPAVTLPSGGTVPVVSALAELGIPVIMMGFARPDDGMHGPNERADLVLLDRGAHACARLLSELGARDAPPLASRQASGAAR